MRLIDADALIAELQKDEERFDKEAEDCRKNSSNYTDCYMQAMSSRADGIRDAIVEVYDAPTIDAVEVVHGEWIKHKERTETNGKFIDFFPAEYECSNCGLREAHYFINSKPHNYCPNCGAKMKGADDEND